MPSMPWAVVWPPMCVRLWRYSVQAYCHGNGNLSVQFIAWEMHILTAGSDEEQDNGVFDVFLCHNSEDKPQVKRIGKQLKQRGLRPWLDEWELRPGFPWQQILEEQIENIRSAAVFVGRSGIGPWQRRESEAFLNEFVERGCPVIPVILPGASKKPRLPVFLKSLTWVDFRHDEPDPLDRLIWGITGRKIGSRTPPKHTGKQPAPASSCSGRLRIFPERVRTFTTIQPFAKMISGARRSRAPTA